MSDDSFEQWLEDQNKNGNANDNEDSEVIEVEEIERSTTGLADEKKKPKKTGRSAKPKKDDSYNVYNYPDIATFLEHVEESPILWDGEHKNYHRREIRQKVADEIEEKCAKFMPRGKIHGSVALKLFKELEADYKKHVLKVQKAKSGSGTTSSSFPYAENMKFLNGAAHKRAVHNAFIVGSLEHQVLEFKSNEDTRGSTPKRKLEELSLETPKRLRKTDHMNLFFKKLEESNDVIVAALNANPIVEEPAPTCPSDRICRTFQEHVKGWPEIEKLTAEAKIVGMIRNLKIQGENRSTSPSSSLPLRNRPYNVPSPSFQPGFSENSNPNFGIPSLFSSDYTSDFSTAYNNNYKF